MNIQERVFILRKVRYGESDLILSCLTSSGARVSLMARGAMRSKKRFGGGVLEPTHYVQVVYDTSRTRGASQSLYLLKEAELLQGFEGLRSDYNRLELALHCVQRISDVVKEGDPDSSELFNLLGNTLRALETSEDFGKLKTQFEVKLLVNQGVLALEGDEQSLMVAPISRHAELRLGDEEWRRLRAKIKTTLAEYLSLEQKSETQ